jgi:hypothetical protein
MDAFQLDKRLVFAYYFAADAGFAGLASLANP